MKPKIFLLGFVIFLAVSIFQLSDRYYPTSTVFSSSSVENFQSNRISIPSLNIDLPVEEREILDDKNWPLNSEGLIKVKDKNIYYGHNWPRILGKLQDIKINDEIYLSDTEYKNTYQVLYIEEVSPDNSEIFNLLSNSDMVMIYTCSGFLDLKRFVVIAKKI